MRRCASSPPTPFVGWFQLCPFPQISDCANFSPQCTDRAQWGGARLDRGPVQQCRYLLYCCHLLGAGGKCEPRQDHCDDCRGDPSKRFYLRCPCNPWVSCRYKSVATGHLACRVASAPTLSNIISQFIGLRGSLYGLFLVFLASRIPSIFLTFCAFLMSRISAPRTPSQRYSSTWTCCTPPRKNSLPRLLREMLSS